MYLSHFNLKMRPFSITSDPEFLYYSKKHREAYDAMVYGIQTRAGFIEVTGNIGSGKTTLCKAVITGLTEKVKTAYVFNSSLTEIQFMQTLLHDLGQTTTGRNRHQLFNDLNHYLIEQLAMDNNVVLIIDEAQNLSVKLLEQIRMLSNLETDKEKLIQIILVGQPELREKLRLPALRQLSQRVAVRYHLTPLEGTDVAAYIYHRLMVAGCRGSRSVFTPDSIKALNHYAQGTPRLINIVCDKALLACYTLGLREVTPGIVNTCIEEMEGVLT